MLTETAEPVFGQDVIDELSRHLKIPTGASGDLKAEMVGALRAAVAYLEGQTSLALIERDFLWRDYLNSDSVMVLPTKPLKELISVGRVLTDDLVEPVDLTFFRLDLRPQKPRVFCSGRITDLLEFRFRAGFGPELTDAPTNLRIAAFMLAAHYFDNRHAVGNVGTPVPYGVGSLIASLRPVRLGMAR